MKSVILRSDPFNVFFLKVAGPAFCLVVSLLLIGGYFPGLNVLHASPFLIAAWFGASLAIVEVRGDVLRYRRLFKWTIIPEGDLVSARVAWGVGSVRLKRLVFPWGRLYFVLDRNSEPNPFRKEDFPLLRYMRKEPIRDDHGAAKSNSQKAHAAELRQMIAALAGALLSTLCQLIFPRPPRSVFGPEPLLPVSPHPDGVIEIVFQIYQFLGKFEFEVTCILFVVFTVLAMYHYLRADAWLYAFLAGWALPYILLHWL